MDHNNNNNDNNNNSNNNVDVMTNENENNNNNNDELVLLTDNKNPIDNKDNSVTTPTTRSNPITTTTITNDNNNTTNNNNDSIDPSIITGIGTIGSSINSSTTLGTDVSTNHIINNQRRTAEDNTTETRSSEDNKDIIINTTSITNRDVSNQESYGINNNNSIDRESVRYTSVTTEGTTGTRTDPSLVIVQQQQQQQHENDEQEPEQHGRSPLLTIIPPTSQNNGTELAERTSNTTATRTTTITTNNSIPILTSKQYEQVDESFVRLFGYKWGTKFRINNNKTTTTSTPILSYLQGMIGSKMTAQILYDYRNRDLTNIIPTIVGQPQKNQPEKVTWKHHHYKLTTNSTNSTSKKRSYEQFVQQQQQQQSNRIATPITTVPTNRHRSPIDGVIPVVSTVPVRSKNSTTTGSTSTSSSGMEKLLHQLATGEKKVSTVVKTSMDWETYKEQRPELKNQLETHIDSNQAYIPKQEFLQRIDYHQYELEKQQRNIERAKRGI